MKLLTPFRTRLIWKFLAAHAVVVLVGLAVWAVAVELLVPGVFERHMGAMDAPMSMDPGMMADASQLFGFEAALNEVLLWGAGASLLAALLTSWLLSRRLVEPIRQMMRASQSIAGGNYQERVRAASGASDADELGQLADSFNRMAATLEQTEQMRLQLIGDISHELRTPLTAIIGTTEGLIDGVLPADAETLQNVHREAARLQRLVQDLQQLSRVEAGSYSIETDELPVLSLLDTIRQRFQPQFDAKGVTLVIKVPERSLHIQADPDRTAQVLTNLVGNALQYTPEGGKVEVEVVARSGEVEFSVRDTGIGIALEDMPHLFQRFFRADKSRARASGGSGIGLTIAKYFVEAQGGRIWAQSDGLGEGARFSFSLPRAKNIL